MRIALAVEYDGALFCGWQRQCERCGVQDHLETALGAIAQQEIKTVAAGRTDTGVHGLSQVVHFDTEVDRPMTAWVQGTNAHLHPAIRVLWASPVSDEFHARYSARGRHYQFVLYNHPVASAVMDKKASWFQFPLNVEKMVAAAKFLEGEHDFTAFRAAECQAKSPIRTLYEASLKKHGDYLVFNFSGNAFLQHQVRNMVGALVYVGKGSLEPDFIQTLLAGKDRNSAPPTFSPDGLYLTGVDYEPHWGLPKTRRYLSFFT